MARMRSGRGPIDSDRRRDSTERVEVAALPDALQGDYKFMTWRGIGHPTISGSGSPNGVGSETVVKYQGITRTTIGSGQTAARH